METLMPTETLLVVAGVAATFAVFTIAVVFVDMTWSRARK
jgi:hypothetical protein